jgi:hypothetical protein
MKTLLSILAYNKPRFENVKHLLTTLSAIGTYDIALCINYSDINEFQDLGLSNIKYIDCTDTNRPQAKNKIIKFAKDNNYSKLHIFEDDIVINDINVISITETLMDMLGYSYVFNHLSNIQNYVCGITAPRLCVGNISDNFGNVDFYSYEGKEYICIDLDKTLDCVLYYDESLNYYYHYQYRPLRR